MSIIHDALKKVQQEQTPGPVSPPITEPIFSDYKPKPEQTVIEHVAPKQNKAKSVLVFLCTIAFIIGSLMFSYKQLRVYFPNIESLAKSSFYQLIHKKENLDFKNKAPEDLKPLAKITVTPPPPKSLNPVKTADVINPIKPSESINPPQTLNIHGVMSNGSSNLVLINDQVYQEGDDVEGVKIVKINLDAITINNNGREEKIPVKS